MTTMDINQESGGQTSMHYSRMRTICCSGCHGEMGVSPGEVAARGCLTGEGVSAWEGVHP